MKPALLDEEIHSTAAPATAPAPAPAAPSRLAFPGGVPAELTRGLAAITGMFPERFVLPPGHAAGSSILSVRFRPTVPARPAARAGSLSIKVTSPGHITIDYARSTDAFRALGILMGRIESGQPQADTTESAAFDTLGVMLDVSRNGVLRVPVIERIIRHLALMGINQLMLYTEDTYEIPGEPLFGYFRGRYTQEDLRHIDDYAAALGIEVVPCIQTLGHLEQVLQWPPYRPLQDTGGVLLAGDAGSEALVEKMIAAASSPFRSRRIHIGMDEAHGIGSGQYRFRNGLQPPFEILATHLERTAAICRRLGLAPMIWSDMYFRLGSRTNGYYDRASVVPPEAAARVPADVQLVYWDYYHTDPEFYDDWIARHRAMGKEPVFAGGVWTWNRPWAALPHSFATLRAGMQSARANGLREAFVTLWGDDGMECDVLSALPAIQFFAELGFAATPARAEAQVSAHFLGSCAASSEAWMAASDLDCTPGSGDPGEVNANPAKWLLWHDPLLNFLDKHIPEAWPAHYAQLSQRCAERAGRSPGDARLGYVSRLAAVLSHKAALHLSLRRDYMAGDAAALRRAAVRTVPALRDEVRALWQAHHALWHELYKPFGWEVIERRYGGLLLRLETLQTRLDAWLAAPGAHPIEELACPSETVYPAHTAHNLTLTHHQAATPSRIL
ncbi:N-acetyl-beta-hexosaminidase [Opitutaceae bacterium TAV1]|nr:N-acetyl-beta-hexosaminidase [Opitutaceae bacterium TAV1]